MLKKVGLKEGVMKARRGPGGAPPTHVHVGIISTAGEHLKNSRDGAVIERSST